MLKKSKFGHDLSDLLEYKSLLSAGSSIPDTIACLRQLQCIHAGREVISEAGIEGTIIDLLFHENRDVSKVRSLGICPTLANATNNRPFRFRLGRPRRICFNNGRSSSKNPPA